MSDQSDYAVHAADWQADQSALIELRTRVFVDEQKVPADMEIDEQDPVCQHFKVTNTDGKIVATARLLSNAYIGRMCVDRGLRGSGIGGSLLQYIIDQAENQGFKQLHLNAQVDAVPFYQRYGFVTDSDIFVEAGIDHQHMTRQSGAE
jgi:predicted GNAT family N-acyltransferase